MYATAPAFSRKLHCDPSGLGHLPPMRRARRYLRGLGALAPIAPRRVTGPYTWQPINPIRVTGPYSYNPTTAAPTNPGWGGSWWNRRTPTTPVTTNTTGQSSTILNYDAAGNPVYSVPPYGVAITSYDQYGTPIYGGQAAGGGQAVIGYQNGQPIYGYSSQLNTAAAAPAASGAAAAPATPADTSGYSDILTWLSGSDLISGVPNWVVAGGAAAGLFWLSNRGGKR